MQHPTITAPDPTIAARILAADRNRRRNRTIDRIVRYILNVLTGAFAGWAFMLAVGIARANWLPGLPTVDFGTAFLLAVLLRLALTALPDLPSDRQAR